MLKQLFKCLYTLQAKMLCMQHGYIVWTKIIIMRHVNGFLGQFKGNELVLQFSAKKKLWGEIYTPFDATVRPTERQIFVIPIIFILAGQQKCVHVLCCVRGNLTTRQVMAFSPLVVDVVSSGNRPLGFKVR